MPRATVAAYDEQELAKLLEHVRDGFARLDAREIHAFDLDDLIHHYNRAAHKLWSFCTRSADHVAGTLAWMRELDGVGGGLVRREAAPDPRLGGEPPEFDARVGARPPPPAGRAVDDAEQRPDRELEPGGEPWAQLFPAPGVHADLAAPAALAVAHEQ